MERGRRPSEVTDAEGAPSARTSSLASRAETLSERLARLASVSLPALSDERVRQLLAPWARAFARGSQAALARRLEWDGLSPTVAAAALSPAEVSTGGARWTLELERYLAAATRLADVLARGDAAALARWRPVAGEVPFLELWLPWLAVADGGFSPDESAACAGLGPAARRDLEALLLADLARLSELAAYERFDEWRRAASAAEGFYREWIAACLRDPLAELYEVFPVLARQSAETVRQWRAATAELARRLVADRAALADLLAGGVPLGAVRAVRGGLADRHGDGRQVLGLEFESGHAVVYKPRSVALEAGLGRLGEWCAAAGLAYDLRAPRALASEGYGWEELVRPERLATRAEAADYFERAGALLALAYALRSRDLHAENLVATRRGPVVVDAEMLLQPTVARTATGGAVAGGDEALGSCLDSGLLSCLERGPQGELLQWGGLAAQERMLSARPSRRWREVNRDGMTVEPGELWLEPHANAVWVGERQARPEEHVAEITAGFTTTYRFLMAHRAELGAEDGPLAVFRGTPLRILFRRSQDYATALALMALPRHQRDGPAAGLLHEALLAAFAGHEARPLLWPLVAEEGRALAARDVPYFTVPADATSLRTASGETVAGYLCESGLAGARRRIAALDEVDLARQLARIEEVLRPPPAPVDVAAVAPVSEATVAGAGGTAATEATATAGTGAGAAATAATEVDAAGRATERCRRAATAIGEALLGEAATRQLDALPWSLGSGRLGPLLLLTALGRCGHGAAAGAAARLLVPLRTALADSAAASELAPRGLGAFAGRGGVLYALACVAVLLDEPDLARRARTLLPWLAAEEIAADDALDLEGGAAGALLGALALAEVTGEEVWLRAAERCADHLLSRQVVVTSAGAAWRNAQGLALLGAAHGAAGIARALAALGEAIGGERYRVAAAAAIGYERAHLDRERGNWPVLLAPDGAAPHGRRSFMLGWCHGAPGIALTRLLLPERFADGELAAEVEIALATTAAAPASRLDHVCCGNLARSAALAAGGERLGDERWAAAARCLAEATLDAARRHGSFRLRPDPLDDRQLHPGFLQGLAGVGWHLLRLGGEGHLPEVLGLELPSEARQRRAGKP